MKVALITGAASGIGKSLTEIHLEQKHHVVMLDNNTQQLEFEAQQFSECFPRQVTAISCDITKEQDIRQCVERVQKDGLPIHWIFNNAGIMGTIAPLWELSVSEVVKVIDVNVMGMVHVIQGFLPLLFKQDFTSRIINIASLYGVCAGSQLAPYSMSKHAVLALSESLHFDLERLNKPVQISVAFPSFTDTSLITNIQAQTNQNFHHSLGNLLTRSRPAREVAEYIVQAVAQEQFYIFPDKEVKSYCESRTQAMILQEEPHRHNIEKLLSSLQRRIKPL